MLSSHDIHSILNKCLGMPMVKVASAIHIELNKSLVTINPISNLPQTPGQVREERNGLLFSVRSLLLKIERINRISRNRLLTIKKLKAKLAMYEAQQADAAKDFEYRSEMNRFRP